MQGQELEKQHMPEIIARSARQKEQVHVVSECRC